MNFDPSILTTHAGEIGDAFLVTVKTWLLGSALGLIVGLALALLIRSLGRWARLPLLALSELIRGTPFLVICFILYYGGPSIGIDLNAIFAGIVCIGFYSSVYFAEIFRSGFNAVPRGQLEAAECLGLGRWQLLVRIELPQMLVIILPALTNLLTVLCKETAILSIITVPELTAVLGGIGTRTFSFAETLVALCLAYLLLVELTARVGNWLERRVGGYLN
ncbi:amino acid ABC transporter permease [Halotalea alkalilenta]|uniref:amino acid ABC transporter permease n=1 Tax=Halotalea alkalilenta TaxID=376489 RepID=UPI0004886E3F|nr:amino acid ABC transporter permease [Halotalea alkalilenta]